MAKLKDFLPRLGIATILGATYFATLAPDFSWANGGVDGGDLITAAWTGGVAHPSGYPLYLALARAFQALPWGRLAARTNLLSALCLLAACLVLYDLIWQMSPHRRPLDRVASAGLATLTFGLAPLVWSQATITEVYTLQLLLLSLVLHQTLLPLRWRWAAKRPNLTRGLTFGLGLANHLTLALCLPLLLFEACEDPDGGEQRFSLRALTANLLQLPTWTRLLTALATASALYLTLLLRGHSASPVKWGNPTGLSGLAWLLSGGLYRGYLQPAAAYLSLRLEALPGLALGQFGLSGIFLGFWGLVYPFRRTRYYAVTLWVALVSLVFSLLYTSHDSFVYLLPLWLIFSLWVAAGIGSLAGWIGGHWAWGAPLLYLCLLAVIGFQTLRNWPAVDISRDRAATDFAAQVLAQAPPQALLLTHQDRDTFSLWYARYALGKRPDVLILVEPFLSQDWYRESLQASAPWLVWPAGVEMAGVLGAANPAHPLCNVYLDRDPAISCP